ncbi:MAG: hypothetical protein J6Z82_10575 [Schwartzia sp.]|nr:hypothetical protein [Schwartzia sp. (in: firmicutes)]
MIALQGVYNKGGLELLGKAPVEKANVVVIFLGETERPRMTEEDRKLFKKFSGSIKRHIDEKKELLEALEEKYARID